MLERSPCKFSYLTLGARCGGSRLGGQEDTAYLGGGDPSARRCVWTSAQMLGHLSAPHVEIPAYGGRETRKDFGVEGGYCWGLPTGTICLSV